jgi:Ca-activated chloride channel homolog
MRMRFWPSVAVVLSLVVAVSLLVALGAQPADRGDITGVVVDSLGSALPGVTVTIVGPEHRQSVTDGRGIYMFRAVLPGRYEVRFELPGFGAETQGATVRAGRTESLRTAMAPLAAVTPQPIPRDRMRVDGPPLGGRTAVEPPPATPVPQAELGRQQAQPSVAAARPTGAPAETNSFPPRYVGPMNTEAYDSQDENPFRRVTADPLSTFSIDVDTASYANTRRFLMLGSLPPAGAVRIEELINYFRFDYPQPQGGQPFSVTTELAECPWNPKHRLALIGLQGRESLRESPPARNLVFLIDVSGSMMPSDKLPLVRNALRMLVDELTERDRVAIVVYAGSSGLVLPSTPGHHKARIHRAIGELEAGGSTNGGEGIQLAYRVAREHYIRGGINRVVLATDGDFNVGVTSQDELVRLIEQQRASGVFLSVLGVGTGNLKDSTMEKLADKGNGNYSYLDSLHEARKVLVREAGATLVTIAKDVKIQVEFNPKTVAGYRLIGYENRVLKHEDFNDDKKDAGDIGEGHSVTALYEIVPVGVEMDLPAVDPLKYQRPAEVNASASADELLTIKLRYKAPDGDESRLISTTLPRNHRNTPRSHGNTPRNHGNTEASLTPNLGFASAVAEVGMLLRDSKHAGSASYERAIARARTFRQDDPEGYRAEFIKLAELAASLKNLGGTKNEDMRRD